MQRDGICGRDAGEASLIDWLRPVGCNTGKNMGCTPWVRQKVKTLVHRVEKSSCLRLIDLPQSAAVGEEEAGNAGEQPARNSNQTMRV